MQKKIFDKINNKGILIGIILLVGMVLRLINLGSHSLWLDEIGQVIVASYPIKELFGMVAQHLSPPLDYLIVKFILIFGNNDWLVRFPAFLYGIMAIGLIYLWVGEIANKKTALIAATFMACSPMAIAFSQEARMYSLFLMLATLSYWLLYRFYNKPTWSNSILLAGANGLVILTHYFGIFLLATQLMLLIILFFLNKQSWKVFWKISCVYLFTILVFTPWLPYFFEQIQHSNGEIWYGLKPKAEFFKMIFSRYSSDTGSRDIWFTLFFIGYIYSIWLAWKQKNWKLIAVHATFIGILGGLFIITFFKRFVTPRNLIFLLPLFYFSLAYVINALGNRAKLKPWAMILFVVIIMSWPVHRYHTFGRPDYKPNFKEAAKYIESQIKDDERVLTTDIHNRGCLAYYLTPNASNVFMKSEWKVQENKSNWIVWKADDKLLRQIENGKWTGWVVLPPNSMHAKTIEDRLRAILNNPIKTYPTQGKGRDLEIYHLL